MGMRIPTSRVKQLIYAKCLAENQSMPLFSPKFFNVSQLLEEQLYFLSPNLPHPPLQALPFFSLHLCSLMKQTLAPAVCFLKFKNKIKCNSNRQACPTRPFPLSIEISQRKKEQGNQKVTYTPWRV